MSQVKAIRDLIALGESAELEFRENVRLPDIARVICSFLNGKGGRLILGVNDNGEIKGLNSANSAAVALEIQAFLINSIVPEAPVSLEAETVEGKEVIIVRVYGGSKQPYIFDGSIFYRRDSQTVKATSKEISDLIHSREVAEEHWERRATVGISLNDLDSKLIKETIKDSQNRRRGNYSGSDVLDFLAHYGLFRNGAFTNACTVLFAKTPSRYIPQIRVRLTEFAEGKTDDVLLRDEVIEDNLFSILDQVERYVNGLGVRGAFAANQWKRQDFKFPIKALQEGVINALMHRDYSSPSSAIAISVLPETITITNSGHLPDELKVSELKKPHQSHPVNPDIAHIFFLHGLIDKLGRGTLKMIEECRKAGLKDPIWKDGSNGVTLTFNGPRALPAKRTFKKPSFNEDDPSLTAIRQLVLPVADGLSSSVTERLISIAYSIADEPGIKATELQNQTGVSKSVLMRDLKLLIDADLILYQGSKRTGGYFPIHELASVET